MEAIAERARTAEAAGFSGIAFMDHLSPPLAEATPMFDAMAVAAWTLASTATLKVSHLVLCESMRHPAVLAKEVVALDHMSKGRFELGLGYGSIPAELTTYGINTLSARQRADRMSESLHVMEALWSGEKVSFEGRWFALDGAQQMPTPLAPIPLIIGGAGPRTLQMVARHATWWNLPVSHLDRFEPMREQAGNARLSLQQMVNFIGVDTDRASAEERANRRFGRMGAGLMHADAAESWAFFAAKAAVGVERMYVWFSDFADPATLREFGATVIAA